MTAGSPDTGRLATRWRRFDPIAALLFVAGTLLLLWVSRLNFLSTAANWDLLNYHAYVPASLLSGSWFTDFHPAATQEYLAPYQDLLWWPIISGLPGPIGAAVIVAVQVSIFVPVGLVIRTVVPGLSTARALGLGLIGASGAMMVTELGSTNGDVLPAILAVWGIYLLLSLLAGQASRPNMRACAAGALVGAAVVLKFTMALIAPGMLVFVIALALAGKPRSALLFVASGAIVATALYAPWAFVLQTNSGSPMFPLYNEFFRAPRFPYANIHDTRFPVTTLRSLVSLPLHQAQGVAFTAETPIRDGRWLVAFLAVAAGLMVAAVRVVRGRAGLRWRAHLPALTLVSFWVVSYVTWAVEFGIQRYALTIEVLALPIVVIGASFARIRLPSRSSLLMLLVLVALLAGTTKFQAMGRRPMTWAPIFPTQTIQPITQYDAIVIGSHPLAYLRAVTRNAPGASNQVWVGAPFDETDVAVGEKVLQGRSVGVVFYVDARTSAESVAGSLGLQLSQACQTFDNPLSSKYMSTRVEICGATRKP
jgi:hypothetical protein